MAKLMTSPDESEFAIVDLTALEYETIYRALQTAIEHANKVGATSDQNDIMKLINALDD